MKRLLPILAALLCACTLISPESVPDGQLQMSFTASHEPGTKTSLQNGRSILWSTSDAVSLFASSGSKGSTFKVSSIEDGGSTAIFSGLSPESANGWYYALYPASDDARLVSASGTVLCGIPTTQNGKENSFDPAAALSLARVNAEASSAGDILHFKNAGALVSLTIPGNWITRIRIESRDGNVAMTGPANISFNDGKPSVSPSTSAKNYVELKVPQGSIGKTFYAVVYPGNYSGGFIVTFYTEDNGFNRYTSGQPLELRRNGNVSLIRKNWGTDDDRSTRSESGTELIAPVIVSGGQISATAASLKFSCSSGKRDTYKLYLRDAASMGGGTLVKTLKTGSKEYGQYSYTFSGLTTGACYDLGVSSSCTGEEGYGDSPVTWLEDLSINESASSMSVNVESSAVNYYNLVVNYNIKGLQSTSAEHGLIFSYSDAAPTCGAVGQEGKLPGPVLNSTGDVSVSQCVPNAALRPGEECHLRAYCYDSGIGSYVYSTVLHLTLPEQPEGYSISKTAMESPAEGISLYSFKANGSWNGYCAEALCNGKLRLKVNNAPMGKADALPMASQLSSSGASVLINGQIFGGQGNIGLAYSGGQLRYNNASEDGIANCSYYGNSYSAWQPVTRAILGVDASGTPGAMWCSLIGGKPYFFDRPIPAGTAVYPQVTASSGPGPARSWSPQEALSTGPMLLYGGKVCVSEDKLMAGVYYTNYELWETTSGNIYGSSRQRTAVGFDSASGKVYLVVVTSNCTLTAMAGIMKGLGCDYAMNLDGGGSTQMQVAGKGELSSNKRNVKSTIGFVRED